MVVSIAPSRGIPWAFRGDVRAVDPGQQILEGEKIQTKVLEEPRVPPVEFRAEPEQLSQKSYDGSCPNLTHDRVLVRPDKSLDLEVLLDLFEKELDFPTISIELSDFLRLQSKIICQEVEPTTGRCIVPLNQMKLAIAARCLPSFRRKMKFIDAPLLLRIDIDSLQRGSLGVLLQSRDERCLTVAEILK